ncbi:MAG: SH3 domain-containing protein [Candidatus Omnitrophica bacterium]|nr:SH3 domain-containing protein [Candidatus Omnitrophota bacterium]
MNLRIIFRTLILCLSLQMGFGYTDSVYAQQKFFPYLAEATGDQVNVRSGQSSNFERLCQLSKGDEVVVLEKGYSWYKIQLPPAARSFVSKEYVQYLGQNAGGVTAERVNIRAGAGIHFTVLGQLAKGEQIYIEEELDEWYRIKPVAESYGWVADQFLNFKSNDVAEYRSRSYSRPVVDEDLFAPVEEEPEEEVAEAQAVEEQDTEKFSAVGYVEAYEDKDNDGIRYKIVVNGRPICYIQGVNHMLGRFMHHKVPVEGTVNKKLRSKYAYPVIIVLKVRLML